MGHANSFHIFSLGVSLALCSLPGFATVTPAFSLGVISPWAVQDYQTASNSFGVDFSLASASVLRFDVRAVEYTYTRVTYANEQFLSASFSVFDSAHQLVGVSEVDNSFAQVSCSGTYAPSCKSNFGLTFTSASALQAGKYTVEFNGVTASAIVPRLKYGATLDGANVTGAYLAAVTPSSAIPEPSSVLLMGLGLSGLAFSVHSARLKRAHA